MGCSYIVTFLIPTTKLADGTHLIEMVACDWAGHENRWVNEIKVSNPPIVENLWPAKSLITAEGWSLPSPIHVDAYDPGGIENVEFYIDGNLVGVDLPDPGTNRYSCDLQRTKFEYFTEGWHIFVVKVYDNTRKNCITLSSLNIGDGLIYITDLQRFGKAWYTQVGDKNYDPLCDFDGDGWVDLRDLNRFGKAWYTQVGDKNYDPLCDI